MKESFRKFKVFLKTISWLLLKIGIFAVIFTVLALGIFYIGTIFVDKFAIFLNSCLSEFFPKLVESGYIATFTSGMVWKLFAIFFWLIGPVLFIFRTSKTSSKKIAKEILKELDKKANEQNQRVRQTKKIEKIEKEG